MISKNFKSLDDYNIFDQEDIQKSTMKRIEDIENKIINDDDFYSVPNTIRTITEDLLLYSFDCEGKGLSEKISILKEKIYIPTGIFQQLHAIKQLGNMGSHGLDKKSDIKYKISITQEDAIIFLRSIWFLFKFALEHNNQNDDIDIPNFDTTVYREKINIEKIKNNDLRNTNDDISTHLLSISQLIMLKDYKFNIPTYQRDYTWDVKNINKLLHDIVSRTFDNKTHYLGSLAIASDEKNGTLRIIDGQQRISTSLILLKAFYDVYKLKKMDPKKDLLDLMKKIGDIYVNQKVLTSQVAVENILKDNLISSEMSIKKSNAFTNYNFIKDWLLENIKIIDELYSTFSTKFEVAILLFSTTIDNEMDIFENLNTGGTQLKSWELIKNYIFSRLDPNIFLRKELDANKFINRNFAIPLNSNSQKAISAKLSIIFTQITRLEHILQKKDILENREIYEVFKRLWPRKEKYKLYDDFIVDLNKLVKRYNIYMEFTEWYKNNSSPLHIYVHILDFIIKEDIAPLLIYVLEKNSIFDEDNKIKKLKNNKFYELIKGIEKYFIRVSVTSGFGNSQSKHFDNYLKENIRNINKESFEKYCKNYMIPKMPSLDEFKEVLSTSGSLKKGAILNILINLEMNLRGLSIRNSQKNPFEKTHEHILAKELNLEDYCENISIENFRELKGRWNDSIGNALILTRNDNSKAGNKKFKYKKNIYKNSSKLAHGLNSKIMNLMTKITFTYEDVQERSKQIAKYVISNLYK